MQSDRRFFMLIKRVLVIVVFVTFAAYSFGIEVQAYTRFNLRISSDILSVLPGKAVSLTVAASADSTVSVAGIYMEVKFDPSVFTLRRLLPLGGVTAGELDFEQTDGVLKIIYCDGDGGVSPVNPGQSGVMSLEFTVDENAAEGSYLFRMLSGDFTDTGENIVGGFTPSDISIEVLPPLSDDASLKLLEVPGFTLTPAFSPQITGYTLDVPSTVNVLSFHAEANDTGAVWRINRTTLKAAGSETEITVTVTAADTRTKEIYTILVSRAEKGVSIQKTTASASKPAAGKPAASKPTVGKPAASKPSAQSENHGIAYHPAVKAASEVQTALNGNQNTTGTDDTLVSPLVTDNGNSFATFFIGLGGGLIILLFYLILRKKDTQI